MVWVCPFNNRGQISSEPPLSLYPHHQMSRRGPHISCGPKKTTDTQLSLSPFPFSQLLTTDSTIIFLSSTKTEFSQSFSPGYVSYHEEPQTPTSPFTSNVLMHLRLNIPCSLQDSRTNRNKIPNVLSLLSECSCCLLVFI